METTKRDITCTTDMNQVAIQFSNGKQLTLMTVDLTQAIIDRATIHGLKQKLVDAAAISRNPDTGATATIQDKFEAVKAVYDRLLNGEWNKVRESGEPRGGLLFAALCRLYPAKTPDAIKTFLADKSKSEQAALRTNPRIATIIAEIQAERADGIDTDEMLDELE